MKKLTKNWRLKPESWKLIKQKSKLKKTWIQKIENLENWKQKVENWKLETENWKLRSKKSDKTNSEKNWKRKTENWNQKIWKNWKLKIEHWKNKNWRTGKRKYQTIKEIFEKMMNGKNEIDWKLEIWWREIPVYPYLLTRWKQNEKHENRERGNLKLEVREFNVE